MSKDLLSEATRALRETESASEFEARATRTRVLTGLHQTRVRHRTRLSFLLPLAASFVAVGAWGAASGQAQLAFERLERFVFVPAAAPGSAKALPKRRPEPLRSTPASPDQATPGVSRDPESKAGSEPASISSVAAPAASSTRAMASPSSSAHHAEREDPTLALYRSAHTAHFVDRDPARALIGWDAYLSAAPTGAFAPEARYNRALSLVRRVSRSLTMMPDRVLTRYRARQSPRSERRTLSP